MNEGPLLAVLNTNSRFWHDEVSIESDESKTGSKVIEGQGREWPQ